MTPVEGVLLGFFLGAVVSEVLHSVRTAPAGWQDEYGFHMGVEPTPLQRRALEDEDQDVIQLHEWAERNHHSQKRGA